MILAALALEFTDVCVPSVGIYEFRIVLEFEKYLLLGHVALVA